MSRAETQSRFSTSGREKEARNISNQADAGGSNSDGDLIGQVIDGRYKILELVGQGGMGSVYKAEHTGIRRVVALKLLHPTLVNVPEISARFEREAFAIGRIEHPNCVNVSDFGELEDGSLYLVMEFLEGHSLGDELADHIRIEPARAMRILRHILRGLGHAHENDIVHRDIKPENVFLVPQENDPDFAKILDFGIAKLIGSAAADDGGTKLTQAGMAFGTPIYMSPEQAVGNPVDGRADLYAASVVAYEMITGKPPFQSDDKLEVMSMHTSREVPPMSEVAPDVSVPPEFEEVIRRGLGKRPGDRYDDADEYIAAITAVLNEPPPLVYTTGSVLVPGLAPHHTGMHGVQQTGMHASPAMNLTGMQVQQARPGNRSKIFVLGAVSLAAVVAVAVFALSSQTSPKSSNLAEKAEDKFERGDPKAVIKLLTAKGTDISKDPASQLQLGHAYAATRRNATALVAYRKALELDIAQKQDAKLRPYLLAMYGDKNSVVVAGAAEILGTHFDDSEARAKLVKLASTARKDKARRLAVEAVERYGMSDQVDWFDSYKLDLNSGEGGCKNRRPAVAKLRALGDKRAIPLLQKALKRKYKGKSTNGCLKEEAQEAIEYLESIDAPDAGPQ